MTFNTVHSKKNFLEQSLSLPSLSSRFRNSLSLSELQCPKMKFTMKFNRRYTLKFNK